MDIEEIVGLFDALPPAAGERWHVRPLINDRIYLSRGADMSFGVFVKGDRESFGVLAGYADLEHSKEVTAYPSGEMFPALRIMVSPGVPHDRLAAHVAYELWASLSAEPSMSNAELLARIEWILRVLGPVEQGMSVERQRGLAGECILLRELLLSAWSQGHDVLSILEKWWGYLPAHRDFAANGFAIEAKATSRASRFHHITSLDQLEPQDSSEKCYLFSVGLRSDPSAPRKLTHIVADVEAALVRRDGTPHVAARDRLQAQLEQYGYRAGDTRIYESGAGFMTPHLPPVLFRETDLARVRRSSFVDSQLPAMVTDVSYDLDVTAKALREDEKDELFRAFVEAPPLQFGDGA